MDFDAITFDTQAVATNGFDFDGGLLAQLKQFKGGPTRAIISSIVISEIRKHLRDKTASAKDALESAHRKAALYGLKSANELAFGTAIDVDTLVKQRILEFFQAIGGEVVKYDEVAVRDVVKMYFEGTPPFSSSSKKKSEFPDAIALLSLEKWANANNAKILAVSGDKDWQSYKSDRITVVDNLADALAKVQVGTDKAEKIAAQILEQLMGHARPDLYDQLSGFLERAVAEHPASATWNSSAELEEDGVTLTFKGVWFNPTDAPFKLVQIGPQKLVIQVDMQLTVDAHADFSVSVWDSIDKEYVSLGSTSAQVQDAEVEAEVLLTLEGDFQSGEVEITEAEIVAGSFDIDFDYIEPDFRGDADDFEEPEDFFPEEQQKEPPTDGHPV